MLAKDTCSDSLIYTTKWVIFRLENAVMLIKSHINFLQIINNVNLMIAFNTYYSGSNHHEP